MVGPSGIGRTGLESATVVPGTLRNLPNAYSSG